MNLWRKVRAFWRDVREGKWGTTRAEAYRRGHVKGEEIGRKITGDDQS